MATSKEKFTAELKQCGERLRRLRILAGFSQVSFAEECGTARNTVIQWEKGGMLPSYNRQLQICTLLNDNLGPKDQITAEGLWTVRR